ncbi:MAG: Spy/CpxP family protein refolding chaperone [Pseudomonadota bacterium]
MTIKHFAILIMALPNIALSQTHSGNHGSTPSAYAGEETRLIKSLSEQDLEEIARGGGWGLARAAELNGVPGPTHFLELADDIGLTEQQRSDIEAIRAQMQADAIGVGERFVAAEQALDAAFQRGAPDAEALERLVTEAGQARAALRLVHLNAHLLTLPLLTDAQVSQYSVLRGYSADLCASVPDGHDPEMWRSHNGCN